PGTFCEAIVTMNSGRAMPTTEPSVNTGAVNSRAGTRSAGSTAVPVRVIPTMTTMAATANAAGTAQRGARRTNSSQITTTGTTPHGFATIPVIGARHSGSSTPASMACAIDGGIAEI